MVDELDGLDDGGVFVDDRDGHATDVGGFFGGFLTEVAGEVEVEEVVGEGGFARARDAGETGKEVEGELEIEVLDVVGMAAGEDEVGVGVAAGFVGGGGGFLGRGGWGGGRGGFCFGYIRRGEGRGRGGNLGGCRVL